MVALCTGVGLMKINKIIISVIIPVYNTEKYLAECLDSVLSQHMNNDIEIICVNDGSTDNSFDILHRYVAEYSCIKVISQKNQGLSCARNAGLAVAKGKYIYFLDSDDMLAENALMEMYKAVEAEELDVLYFDASILYESKEMEEKHSEYNTMYQRLKSYGLYEYGQILFNEMVTNNEYCVSSCLQLINREFLEKTKLRYYPGILHEDNLFNFQCMLQAGKVCHIAKPYFVRRVRNDSIMTQEKKFENFYGLCVTYKEMLLFIERGDIHIDKICEDAIKKTIENIRRLASNIYTTFLNEEDKRKRNELPIGEQIWINSILRQDAQQYKFPIYPFPNYLLEYGSRVVLYGAGNIGQRYYKQIAESRYVEVVSWVDKRFIQLRENGYSVDLPNTIKSIEFDFVFLAVADRLIAQEIISELENMGIVRSRIVWYGTEYCVQMNEQIKQLNSRLELGKQLWNTTSKKIYLFMTPEHGNLGDYAIALSEREFLREYFADIPFIEVTTQEWQKNRELYSNVIRREDVIFISGGGYIGDMWQSGMLVKEIITAFPDNKKIMFPNTLTCVNNSEQTMYKEAEFYRKQNNLYMFAREKYTYCKFLKYGFRVEDAIKLYPDMALFLLPNILPIKGRDDVLLCFRTDIEKVCTEDVTNSVKHILNELEIIFSETNIHLYRTIKRQIGGFELEKKLQEFGNARMVITDRLHGMILSAIVGTPCIAFDNATHKVRGVYHQWLRHLPYIKFVDENTNLRTCVIELLTLCETKYESEEIQEQREQMAEYINTILR